MTAVSRRANVSSAPLKLAGKVFKALAILLRRPAENARMDLLHRFAHLPWHPVLRGADDALDLGKPDAVNQIIHRQHMCGRNEHRSQLVQGNRDDPVFVMPLEQHHDPVSPSDPPRSKQVGRLIAQPHDVAKGKRALLILGVAPDQRTLPGGLLCDRVHHVIAKIEILRIVQPEAGQTPLAVKGLVAE